MTAYYNEIDRFCCDWLSNLMDAGLITPGKIDDRSIHDVAPDDVARFERVHFFAGIGGWDYSLTLAGWSGPVWTGSCPCQPFSLAGAQKGFDDTRHLWPEFKRLIAQRRPATVFGEQVASATEWLRLVRSELEAMGYAVGAMPVQAASAGADHLRDRYWFVASNLGDASGTGLAFGSIAEVERGDSRGEGPPAAATGNRGHALANADIAGASEERPERSREFGGIGGDPQARDGRYLADGNREFGQVDQDARGSDNRGRARPVSRPCSADDGNVVDAAGFTEREPHDEGNAVADGGEAWPVSGGSGDHLEWVVGADGKARRVKPGIRLLAHGVPNRVGLLRGFGNAIDPRPAAQFIAAAREAMTFSLSLQHSPGGAHE